MAKFSCFEEIKAWQDARELTARIYSLSSTGALSRDYDLQRQLRRAAVSIMSNIAEGFERGGTTEFLQFLSIAKGSCGEVRSQIYVAADAGYISNHELQELLDQCRGISRQLQGLISYLQRSQHPGPKFRGRTKKNKE